MQVPMNHAVPPDRRWERERVSEGEGARGEGSCISPRNMINCVKQAFNFLLSLVCLIPSASCLTRCPASHSRGESRQRIQRERERSEESVKREKKKERRRHEVNMKRLLLPLTPTRLPQISVLFMRLSFHLSLSLSLFLSLSRPSPSSRNRNRGQRLQQLTGTLSASEHHAGIKTAH